MILSQTKIFFGSIQVSSVVKILFSYCSRYTYEYISHRELLLNRLYFNISSSNKKQCLTIDARDVSSLGPVRFRTEADYSNEQFWYFNRNKKDNTFNCFFALRKQTLTVGKIIFSVENLIDRSNKKEDIYFKINDKLNEFNNDVVQFEPRIRQVSEGDGSRETVNIRLKKQSSNNENENKEDMTESPDFF